ncbi:ribosome maturation factor RimP [Thermodesulfomicrobium sp. WS]|uniref:ribosome maturation factor RimP n=1 Tax=Thermodesulfomicrobium sp. WS TaxID=3004129 RepID=UPI0024913873|nr:ribosome maturation factor RimP [Thermodesulfomicrobium sp. WS]BDV01853.1 ribosome maturation factor RimP [Thermodesulfomicrobium sp. WS]
MTMDTTALRTHITSLAQTACLAHGISLWGIEFGGGSRRLVVRVYVDAPGGVTIEHCEAVSKHLSLALDVEDPIPGAYTLEVSSPGLDRLFFHPEQLASSVGATIRVRLRAAMDGRKNFQGVLQALEDDTLVLAENDRIFRLPWPACAKVQLVYDLSPAFSTETTA